MTDRATGWYWIKEFYGHGVFAVPMLYISRDEPQEYLDSWNEHRLDEDIAHHAIAHGMWYTSTLKCHHEYSHWQIDPVPIKLVILDS